MYVCMYVYIYIYIYIYACRPSSAALQGGHWAAVRGAPNCFGAFSDISSEFGVYTISLFGSFGRIACCGENNNNNSNTTTTTNNNNKHAINIMLMIITIIIIIIGSSIVITIIHINYHIMMSY